jgi:hypothetical protein
MTLIIGHQIGLFMDLTWCTSGRKQLEMGDFFDYRNFMHSKMPTEDELDCRHILMRRCSL